MRKKISATAKEELKALQEKKVTRKEAIKKTGYMALSAATLMMLLPTKGQAQTSPKPAAPTNTAPNNQKGIWDD
ncbi:MAG TPA: hypothetical protein VFG54_04285 [Prolixibacteraceae bacterium]|nr:hypothetical protein [Prolixibacteraceae bacterium]